MKKDFGAWHNQKTAIDISFERLFFQEGEVWFCHLGANVGCEEDGRGEQFLRPVIVLRKFNRQIFWAIPLTKSQNRKNKTAERYYHNFSFLPGVVSVAILSQVRLIDAKRLRRRIGIVSKEDLARITEKLKALLP